MKKYEFGGMIVMYYSLHPEPAQFYRYGTYDEPEGFKGTGEALKNLGLRGWMICGVYTESDSIVYLMQREIAE